VFYLYFFVPWVYGYYWITIIVKESDSIFLLQQIKLLKNISCKIFAKIKTQFLFSIPTQGCNFLFRQLFFLFSFFSEKNCNSIFFEKNDCGFLIEESQNKIKSFWWFLFKINLKILFHFFFIAIQILIEARYMEELWVELC
jgi:hypothetical protein